MPQKNENILSPSEIKELEQNYITNSAPFVDELLAIFDNYSDIDYITEGLKQDFESLYKKASSISSTAIPYAELTTSVFADDAEVTVGLISDLKEYYSDKFTEKKRNQTLTKADKNAIVNLAKVAEHLNLALTQKNSLYMEQKEKLDSLEDGLNSEQEELKNFNDSLKSLEKSYKSKYDKMTIDFLSMMGIFSTIIFAVFGGLSQIGAIGDNLAETPISKILMYVSLSSITLILIVFISFNAISKLTGLKLRSCTCKKEEECTCTLRQKHPSLSFSLFFFVDLFLFSLVLKAIRYSDWVSPFRDIFVFKTDNFLKLIIFSIFIIFNGLVLLKLLFPQSKRFFIRWIKFI